MLHEFLLAERDEILALCSKKIVTLAGERSSSDEMEKGLPVFYDELIEVLRADTDESALSRNNAIARVHTVFSCCVTNRIDNLSIYSVLE